MSLDAADPALLAPYVTNLDRPVFALRGLPEEVVAVLFAYYSRSPHSLRENLAKLLREGDLALQPAAGGDDHLAEAKERARSFHEKWVVGYGHASVAEHAVVHLAVEDVSIVASKAVEDCRLASYTEKSTRYVVFDAEHFVRPPELSGGAALAFEAACRGLLGLYASLMPRVEAQLRDRLPKPDDWTERRWESTIRAQACDILRYLLPAATRTNLGLTINGRALEGMLTKLYSSRLAELRELAAALQAEAQQIIPTLIKYAAPNVYRQETAEAMRARAEALLPPPAAATANTTRLVAGPERPLEQLATAILYEHGQADWAACREVVSRLDEAEQGAVVEDYLTRRGRFDAPGRALEHVSFTFEVLLDYGAYRDIQRHRMCTQTDQLFGPALGWETPPEVEALGFQPPYETAVRQAVDAHAVIAAAHGPEVAQYVLPLACRKRLVITWNLRELHHFISLRSGRQGHRSYRLCAQECWRELERCHPELARGIRVDWSEVDWARG